MIASCIQSYYAKADALLKMNELDLRVCEDDQQASFVSNLMNDCLIVNRVINIYPITSGIYLIFKYFIDENISNLILLLKGCFFKQS